LSQLDTTRRALRHRDGEPVFAEQWHAQVIAVVELLIEEGKIDAEDWSQTLGAELDRRAAKGAQDSDETYYSAFLSALEQILARESLAAPAEVDKRESDWRQAYLSTPHGKPVFIRDQVGSFGKFAAKK